MRPGEEMICIRRGGWFSNDGKLVLTYNESPDYREKVIVTQVFNGHNATYLALEHYTIRNEKGELRVFDSKFFIKPKELFAHEVVTKIETEINEYNKELIGIKEFVTDYKKSRK